jgi:gas vesicle protein
MSFGKGLITGLVFGSVLGLLANKHSGQENRARAQQWGKDTLQDVQQLRDGVTKLQTSLQHLQTAEQTNLAPAIAGIQKDTAAFNFKIAPHLAKIDESIARINSALPSTDEDDD